MRDVVHGTQPFKESLSRKKGGLSPRVAATAFRSGLSVPWSPQRRAAELRAKRVPSLLWGGDEVAVRPPASPASPASHTSLGAIASIASMRLQPSPAAAPTTQLPVDASGVDVTRSATTAFSSPPAAAILLSSPAPPAASGGAATTVDRWRRLSADLSSAQDRRRVDSSAHIVLQPPLPPGRPPSDAVAAASQRRRRVRTAAPARSASQQPPESTLPAAAPHAASTAVVPPSPAGCGTGLAAARVSRMQRQLGATMKRGVRQCVMFDDTPPPAAARAASLPLLLSLARAGCGPAGPKRRTAAPCRASPARRARGEPRERVYLIDAPLDPFPFPATDSGHPLAAAAGGVPPVARRGGGGAKGLRTPISPTAAALHGIVPRAAQQPPPAAGGAPSQWAKLPAFLRQGPRARPPPNQLGVSPKYIPKRGKPAALF